MGIEHSLPNHNSIRLKNIISNMKSNNQPESLNSNLMMVNNSKNRISKSKSNNHKRNLSATFNYSSTEPDLDYVSTSSPYHKYGRQSCCFYHPTDLVDINTATEEQLMTLPGVGRQTAKNIVEYRRAIGGFRKVEDLALVSGVGATKLDLIRSEICVMSCSQNSSASSSGIDLSLSGCCDNISQNSVGCDFNGNTHNKTNPPLRTVSSSGSCLGLKHQKKVNVNVANVFQLMKIKFLDQAKAERIVSYREAKGPYKKFEDLTKVKGIKVAFINVLKHYLVLKDEKDTVLSERSNESENLTFISDDSHNKRTYSLSSSGGKRIYNSIPGSLIPKLSSMNLESNNGINCNESRSSVICTIPEQSENKFSNGKLSMEKKIFNPSLVRIATWNLQDFSHAKALNVGVREVIAMTILKKRFAIIAIQDIQDDYVLQQICDDINSRTLECVKKISQTKRNWRCIISKPSSFSVNFKKHQGFIYDSDQEIEVLNSSDVKSSHTIVNLTDYSVALFNVNFRVKSKNITLVNCQAYLNKNYDVQQVLEYDFQSLYNISADDNTPIIFLGFFGINSILENLTQMTSNNLLNITSYLPNNVYTDIKSDLLKGSICSSNILLNPSALSKKTEKGGVVRDGLNHPLIPNGWKWNGLVSQHCPVWVELLIT